ncbi:DUF397 domain-containing protein [Micromonospora sp. NPDC049559]|uniref:DUF397 domain-containing protein n=1 Tax=Micromonospora sp. NPDC049559 TaxID=3155923 RepID=UPI0034194F06
MSETGSVKSIWRKSIRCESQQCVEVAEVEDGVAIRNSTDPHQHIVFGAAAWRGFMTTLRKGNWG